jgi:hypothetical protein
MMPRDDDPWRRLREREEEEAAEKQQVKPNPKGVSPPGRALRPDEIAREAKGGSAEKLVELIERGTPMLEQVNNLYNMYFSGAEKRAPIERRQQLDQIAQTVQLMAKPTPTLQFRATTFLSSYRSFIDRWDRLMKDLEKKAGRPGSR